MITPPYLQPGDQVVLIAPGRKMDEQAVQRASELFTSWELKVSFAKNLFSQEHSYFSATDSGRLEDLQQAINDPGVKAIICCRGGYGTTRIIDQADFSALQNYPKWLCGFSDVTALHLKLLRNNLKSIHGTMPVMFDAPDATLSIESLRRALFGKSIEILFPSSPGTRKNSASGTITGGNLSLIVDSLGTSSELETAGRILVIEEVDEYLYRLDRMMVQLDRAGKLKDLAGLIVGHFSDLKDTDTPFGETLPEIINNHTKNYNYPVAFNFPSGHRNPNIAWIHGAEATLEVDNDHSTLRVANA